MENSPSLYAQASAAAGRGDKLAARRLLDELIINEPNNEQAWLLLAEVVDDLNEVSDCLQHALAIDPQNQAALHKYGQLLRQHQKLVELDPAIVKAKKDELAERKQKLRRRKKLRR